MQIILRTKSPMMFYSENILFRGAFPETPRPLAPCASLRDLQNGGFGTMGVLQDYGKGKSQTRSQMCLEYAVTRRHDRQGDLCWWCQTCSASKQYPVAFFFNPSFLLHLTPSPEEARILLRESHVVASELCCLDRSFASVRSLHCSLPSIVPLSCSFSRPKTCGGNEVV